MYFVVRFFADVFPNR